ncbi:MAG: hypothetical protein WBN04_13765 [Paracoccaceae bacterium]
MKFGILAVVATSMTLGACSGGGGSGPRSYATPEEAFAGRTQEASDLTDELGKYHNASWSGMPTKGSAKFDGFSAITIDTASQTLALIGLAELKANFGAGTVTGTLTDFNGGYSSGSIDAYGGNITVSNGQIGLPVPNAFIADYNGTLTGNSESVVLGGGMTGVFKATPIRGVLAASDALTATAAIDGVTAVDSALVIVAKK